MTEPALIMRPYRHRRGSCSRLLFEAYLPAGAKVKIRCPSCGGMHVITSNGTGVLQYSNGNGHNLTNDRR